MLQSLIMFELNKLLSSYLPMTETLEKTDVFLLESVRQLVFATEFGYLAQLMESMDITAQAQQSLMEQRYEKGLIPETEED